MKDRHSRDVSHQLDKTIGKMSEMMRRLRRDGRIRKDICDWADESHLLHA